jgi:hypothetical protein
MSGKSGYSGWPLKPAVAATKNGAFLIAELTVIRAFTGRALMNDGIFPP